jgi:glycosyltransferase involved in cell wall biosynthesis
MQPTRQHVTLVIGSLGAGGAERNLLRLAQGLLERGFRSTVMTLNPAIADFYPLPDGVERAVPLPGATVSPRWFDLPAQWRARRALRESLLATQPDVVISFIDTCNVQVLSALTGSTVPVVVSERTDWRYHALNWRWRALRRWTYPRARYVVSLASAPVQDALRYWPRWRCVHIANPVPRLTTPATPHPAWCGQHHLVAMGRLVPSKGHDLLLRAFATCVPRHPDWDLSILGDGPERAGLAKLAQELGVQDRVHFCGNVSPPFGLLAAADLFVFASLYEAFGMALAEAMACGLPVISFDCPSGPADIIRNGEDGVLVPTGNVPALAAAMNCLMGDAGLRQRMSRRAPEVCDRFEPGRILDQWCEVIKEAVGLKNKGKV